MTDTKNRPLSKGEKTMCNPQSNKEIPEYISGQRMATKKGIYYV